MSNKLNSSVYSEYRGMKVYYVFDYLPDERNHINNKAIYTIKDCYKNKPDSREKLSHFNSAMDMRNNKIENIRSDKLRTIVELYQNAKEGLKELLENPPYDKEMSPEYSKDKVAICVVPSSTPGQKSGMTTIAKNIATELGADYIEPFVRITKKETAHLKKKDNQNKSASRKPLDEYLTLSCAPINHNTVIIMDDVVTSGSSMFAAKEIITARQREKFPQNQTVICIALEYTNRQKSGGY